ncbi:hypothetical protein CMI49_02475 [Candidatus Pacearchaeota archaeon]|nr:hypothetical protein [Candidatus Pacearchaeota archaeon]
MLEDNFQQKKKDSLSKLDKSSKGEWDEDIINLCDKINSLKNYYTTSSCSGRIVLMIDQDKKEEGLFIKVYHDLISFQEFKKDLNKIIKANKKRIKFKLEPCILHVACENPEEAFTLYTKAKLAGWKKSGMISFGNRAIVELNSTEKLEFPLINKDKILVDDIFLKIVVQESNKKLKKSWEKIKKLRNSLK